MALASDSLPTRPCRRVGASGIGEVYRARDERLKRDVAIKVLPASYSSEPDRLRRFEPGRRRAVTRATS